MCRTAHSGAQSFGAGATGVGLASSAFSMARLAINVPAGVAGDRFGRKPLLILGPLLMAAGGCARAMLLLYGHC